MTKPIRALVLLLTLAPIACDDGGEPSHARTEGVLALEGDTMTGMTTFTAVCGVAACHGADGNTPGTPETKKLGEVIPGFSDTKVVDTILKGDGPMPPQTQLSDQEIADVLAYVRDTFG